MNETDQTTLAVVELAKANEKFRKVVKTGEKMQLVLMAIQPGEDIGGETHEGHDQVLVFVEGKGVARIGDTETEVSAGDLSFVPSGKYHNFLNTGSDTLKLYTLYSPPEHEAGVEASTRDDAA